MVILFIILGLISVPVTFSILFRLIDGYWPWDDRLGCQVDMRAGSAPTKKYEIYLLGKSTNSRVEEFLYETYCGDSSPTEEKVWDWLTKYGGLEDLVVDGKWVTSVDKNGFITRKLKKYQSVKLSRIVEVQ